MLLAWKWYIQGVSNLRAPIFQLREYAYALNKMIDDGATDAELKSTIESQMTVIFRIIGICLGIPPETFTWQYYDKSKKYNDVREITPLEFYTQHVKPAFDMSSKICLVSDPRPHNPYGKLYSVEFLGNVVGGKKTVYNNQPIEALMRATAESINRYSNYIHHYYYRTWTQKDHFMIFTLC